MYSLFISSIVNIGILVNVNHFSTKYSRKISSLLYRHLCAAISLLSNDLI
jgi:hypothetical protein